MTISQEEYLKTIYFLLKENKKARVTDIATTLGYSKASVNKAIKLLKEMNMINYESYGDVQLTKEGEKQAKNIVNKHNILKAAADVDKAAAEAAQAKAEDAQKAAETAEEEAKSMKHAISEDTAEKFANYIKSIIPVQELECNYDLESEKCKTCIRLKTKKRFDQNNK